MKLEIHIDSENAACRDREDVLCIVDNLIHKIRVAGTDSKHKILDANGQSVGWYSISQDDPDEDAEDDNDDVIEIPQDFPVRPLAPTDRAEDRVTCGTCGLSWDDSISTTYTPAPSGRCPFEHFHLSQDTEEDDKS